jgi:predicted GNAT family acetyltransferase
MLAPGRPYYVITTPDLREAVLNAVQVEQPERNHVYILDLARFHETVNVLVVAEQGVGGHPRFVIRSQGEVAAEAAISWLSPYFAEISVYTRPAARGRGWGRSVVGACARWVTRSGRRALYVAAESNEASAALAKATGFVDTGVREFAGTGVCRGEAVNP